MVTKEDLRSAIREHGLVAAASKLNLSYTAFLRLRRQYGMFVRSGTNQYDLKGGLRWSRLRPFDVITNNYYRSYKSSAKRRGLVFELTLGEFKDLASTPCYHCGTLACRVCRVSSYKRKRNYRSKVNGVDRLDSSIGYVAENCVPCCTDCNRAKWEMTTDQFHAWVKRISNFLSL